MRPSSTRKNLYSCRRPPAWHAQVGLAVPDDVELFDVPHIPDVPSIGGYRYTVADNDVVLVDPITGAGPEGDQAGLGARVIVVSNGVEGRRYQSPILKDYRWKTPSSAFLALSVGWPASASMPGATQRASNET